MALCTSTTLELDISSGLRKVGRKDGEKSSEELMEMTLSIRSMVSQVGSLRDRMRCVTLMEFLMVGFSFGIPFFFFFPSPLALASMAPFALTRSRVVLREVATNSQSPTLSGSDSSLVVGAMASNLATAFMNFALSLGSVMKSPVGDREVSLEERVRRSDRAARMGGAPAASSVVSMSDSGVVVEESRGSVSTSDGTSAANRDLG